MKTYAVAAAVFGCSLVVSTVAQERTGQDVTAALTQLHNEWFAAFNRGDGEAMDRLEVPNLVLVNATGKGEIWQKTSPRGKAQKPTGATTTLREVVVRQFGDTAILTGRVAMTQGKDQRTSATTFVCVKQNGRWMIASVQWTDISS